MIEEVGGIVTQLADRVGQVLRITEGEGLELGEGGEVNQVLVRVRRGCVNSLIADKRACLKGRDLVSREV